MRARWDLVLCSRVLDLEGTAGSARTRRQSRPTQCLSLARPTRSCSARLHASACSPCGLIARIVSVSARPAPSSPLIAMRGSSSARLLNCCLQPTHNHSHRLDVLGGKCPAGLRLDCVPELLLLFAPLRAAAMAGEPESADTSADETVALFADHFGADDEKATPDDPTRALPSPTRRLLTARSAESAFAGLATSSLPRARRDGVRLTRPARRSLVPSAYARHCPRPF